MERHEPAMTDRARPGESGLGTAEAPASTGIRAILRRRIVDLALAPGAAISEKALSQEFGVSRTPVRDALLRLAEENLVWIRPQRGTFAARIDLGAVRDAMVIRQALERVTVRAAAGAVRAAGAPGPAAARLRAVLDHQALHDAADDLPRFHQADDAFHAGLAELGGHATIWRVIKAEKAHVERCRALAAPVSERRRTVMAQHHAILRAVEAGDADAAEAAMADHLSDVLPNLAPLRERHPDYFRP